MEVMTMSDINKTLDKYPEAEKMFPSGQAFERVTIFTWRDMLNLRDEIQALQSKCDAYEKDARAQVVAELMACEGIESIRGDVRGEFGLENKELNAAELLALLEGE
jgi:hypothetical protein